MINYTEKEILEILKDEQKTDEFLATLTGEDVKKLLTYINSKVRNIPNEENDVYNGYMVVGALISPKNDIQNRCFEKIAESLKNIKGNRNRATLLHYLVNELHLFTDGNGRCARLWQNVILSNWEKVFEYVPIESEIKKYQEEYYSVINECNKIGESTKFVEFMLRMIDEVLNKLIDGVNNQINHTSLYVKKLLNVMEIGVKYTSSELMSMVDMKSRASFRENYLIPAIDNGFIKMTFPNNPTNKNQTYYRD